MAEIPDKYLEEAREVAAQAHGAARDDKDIRTDRVTAKLLDMVDHLQRDIVTHMKEEGESVLEIKDGLARVEVRVEEFIKAFPNKDPIGHLLSHEKEIKDAEKREAFWEKIKFTLTALILTAAVGWVGLVMWKAFLIGPK